MDSREVVRRTLEFENPERVAHSSLPSDFIADGPQMPNPENEPSIGLEPKWQQIASDEFVKKGKREYYVH